MFSRSLSGFVVSLLIALNANALTLNFDSLSVAQGDFSANIGNSYSEQGFKLVGTPPSYWPSSGFNIFGQANILWTGTSGLTYYGVGSPIYLSEISGELFNLNSIDLARGDNNQGLIPVGFSGIKGDGSIVTANYYFTNTLKGHLETFILGADFSNLKSVIWHQGAEWHQFDNINVSTVPVPNSSILFILGFAIVVFVLRKNREA